MTIQPGDRRGRLRASHADREHVIDTLKTAFVQGRLTRDELDTRVGQTLAARTYAELAALTDDLPVLFIDDIPVVLADGIPAAATARPPRHPGRRPMNNAAKAGLSVIVAAAVLAVLTVLTGGVALAPGVVFYFMALLVAGAQMLYSRQQRRACGPLPPGPPPPGPPPPGAHTPAAGQRGTAGAGQRGTAGAGQRGTVGAGQRGTVGAGQGGSTSQGPGFRPGQPRIGQPRPDGNRADLRVRRPVQRRPIVPLATGSCG